MNTTEPIESQVSNQAIGGPNGTITASASASATKYNSRAAIVKSFPVPTNEFGLPIIIYRADFIPEPEQWESMCPTEQTRVQDMAAVDITYDEGYPTTVDGTLIWDQLPHEGDFEFGLFRTYLEQGQLTGYRNISKSFGNISPEHIRGIREISQLYFWSPRARAYDMIGQAAYRRVREQRAMYTEDYHYLKLAPIVEAAYDRFGRFTADDYDTMNPLETTKMLKELVALQRQTVGLSPNGQSNDHVPGENSSSMASMEIHLRTIAKTQSQGGNGSGSSTNTQVLLNDEDTARTAQELVIKMMRQNNG